MRKNYILLLICFFCSIYSYCQKSKYEKSIEHISEVLNCNRDYAKWIIQITRKFSNRIQSDIERIANPDDSYSEKIKEIPTIISNNFVSEDSKIDVSSKYTSYLDTYTIQQYLYRLSKIKKTHGYSKVQLLFEPDYLGMGRFYKVSDNTYELSISMWQIFRSWYGDNRKAYEDATKKKFRLYFYCDSKNKLKHIKIDRVLATETISIEELNHVIR